MPTKLDVKDANFATALQQALSIRSGDQNDVTAPVKDIIAAVREKGDSALLEYTSKFDRFDATIESIKVTPEDIANALSLCSPELMKSLKLAASRIRSYSEKQLPDNLDYKDELGVRLGHKWNAIQAVGLYVPGGTASYPSSVLMNAIPAIVAGVKRLVMVVPSPEGKLNPAVLAAAHVAGIEEIYKVGGAQAVAALAYGTQTIVPVDKIVGPGNAYVAEAKRQVFGAVGIDMIAGPSEILVVADDKNDPKWIAADLLSQAEHDVLAQSVLITDSKAFAVQVEEAIAESLKTLPRAEIAGASWENYGTIITVENWNQACDVINAVAPEHLELAIEDPESLLPNINCAGAIFMGRYTPEAMGDYIAGPSHVLPTTRTARFSSGLSVFDFLTRSSLVGCDENAFNALADYTTTLADSEGLDAHALSVRVRKTS